MVKDTCEIPEGKQNNRGRIARYISGRGSAAKSDIARDLHLSMPTTLQNVKALISLGILTEEGEYASTGGRKPKALSIAREAGYALGVDITNNHVTMVLVNARKEIIHSRRMRQAFEDTCAYMDFLKREIQSFIKVSAVNGQRLGGIGFSLPGIVDREKKLLLRSHTLRVENMSFSGLGESLGYPYTLKNDANSAASAELDSRMKNAVYLSLSGTVGGAVYIDGKIYEGERFKSAEFGHMILEREGRSCYCGKKGCLDAYCRAGILQEAAGGTLEDFFCMVREGDKRAGRVWEEYLEFLAAGVSNLRMAFDCPIVLGGYVGGYMEEFMPCLAKKVEKYNNFDKTTDYLYTGRYKLEASAYGVSLEFIDSLLENIP